ncbi:MAG: alkaline phosphatase family protein [Bacteroidetes bacterium]|nr:alkaline phosphatase family protein [Bacteroidota bacterium]
MKNREVIVRVVPLLFWLSVFLQAGGAAQNVVIAVIDGSRDSETMGAGYTPMMWDSLLPQGTLWTDFRNEGITLTNPGHASIATGTWQTIDNEGNQRPTMPTVFEYYRSSSSAAETDVYVVAGKYKLNILSYSTHPSYGEPYGASVSLAPMDGLVLNASLTAMGGHHPQIVIINFPDVDYAGHSADWERYLNAIRTVDSLVYELWQFIQSDPHYKDNTTLFITNDHGRHDDGHGGFKDHGDGCEGCRHILLLAVGRGFPAAHVVATTRTQIDIAPTVGELLSFPVPYALGTSLLADTVRTAVVEDPPGAGVAREFALHQNYPNPFNPTTAIGFTLPVRTHVTLDVLDSLGEQVALLVNSVKGPGTHTVTFDGEGLASGIYLYRLRAGDNVEARRMVLAK